MAKRLGSACRCLLSSRPHHSSFNCQGSSCHTCTLNDWTANTVRRGCQRPAFHIRKHRRSLLLNFPPVACWPWWGDLVEFETRRQGHTNRLYRMTRPSLAAYCLPTHSLSPDHLSGFIRHASFVHAAHQAWDSAVILVESTASEFSEIRANMSSHKACRGTLVGLSMKRIPSVTRQADDASPIAWPGRSCPAGHTFAST